MKISTNKEPEHTGHKYGRKSQQEAEGTAVRAFNSMFEDEKISPTHNEILKREWKRGKEVREWMIFFFLAGLVGLVGIDGQ